MDNFVVGLLFDFDKEWILLQIKKRPPWQNGFLNGFGGKIKKGETIHQAIKRETFEEIGIKNLDWHYFSKLSGRNRDGNEFNCHFFFSNTDRIFEFEQKEDELLILHKVSDLLSGKLIIIQNLKFLVQFVLCDDGSYFIDIEY